MAQIQDSSTLNHMKTKPKTNTCFLGCFGFSGKVSDQEPTPPDHMVKPGSRKKTRWFSWSRFRAKNSVAKTVPVDVSSEKVINRSKSISTDKSKVSSKHHIPATGLDQSQVPAANKPPKCKTRSKTAQHNIILQSRKSLDPFQANACQTRLSDSRKIEIQRTGVSQPGSPVYRTNSRQTTTLLSHSAPFPVQRHEKQPAVGKTGNSRMKTERKHRHRESDTLAGKFDQVVGMSIIMVTLIIMLVWGRFCAILCTCAWFYVIPSLRIRAESRKEPNIGGSDLNSEEYKKKVVLEGFLERNHRNNAYGSP
ncbi:uncharacterized protein At5g23160-like [Cornus florida]|uniref:uncharacterized protein At5g23160-like n=1 Tax=Cornus florida TaxID=4283 RepID=UPI00289E2F1D|nr:uncharacterized protein At5g23160-like [Cornus florida]